MGNKPSKQQSIQPQKPKPQPKGTVRSIVPALVNAAEPPPRTIQMRRRPRPRNEIPTKVDSDSGATNPWPGSVTRRRARSSTWAARQAALACPATTSGKMIQSFARLRLPTNRLQMVIRVFSRPQNCAIAAVFTIKKGPVGGLFQQPSMPMRH